ncbi:hypothetical protein AALP_AA4G114700 [Arabis alpina]|uniref:Uncharacterized protein n=1 Tax=Arabis alpina TaxID=50452 RepID=A0A087H2L9_ARAAL|nr:hypothetical protein AALP_AA4G114700 [Arabis alpina]
MLRPIWRSTHRKRPITNSQGNFQNHVFKAFDRAQEVTDRSPSPKKRKIFLFGEYALIILGFVLVDFYTYKIKREATFFIILEASQPTHLFTASQSRLRSLRKDF